MQRNGEFKGPYNFDPLQMISTVSPRQCWGRWLEMVDCGGVWIVRGTLSLKPDCLSTWRRSMWRPVGTTAPSVTSICHLSSPGTIGIFRQNEYIPYGNDLVPYENAFIPRGNELIPTSCWNLHKPKLPKIKTF